MQLEIQSMGFSLTNGIKDHITRHMQFALNRHDALVMRARVSLADINGPRGGIDKRCRIELKIAGQNNVVIEDTDADLYFAINRACDRCMRTLSRQVSRAKLYSHTAFPTSKLTD